jgi:hypothetical protein
MILLLLLGYYKLIKDYLYYNNELIYENKLIGLEVEKIKNDKYETIDYILYSSESDIKYNNMEYIGNITNLSNIYLFDKDDSYYFNKIINIIKSYKYSDGIINTINKLNDKIMLNEIYINNVYIYKGKYSNNKNDILLYFLKNNIKLVILLSMIYFTIYLIEYFFGTHFWC